MYSAKATIRREQTRKVGEGASNGAGREKEKENCTTERRKAKRIA
jgi:hypothetical protein